MEIQKGSLKSTIAVSLTNYLDAGAIVAGASGLSLWQDYLHLTGNHLAWLNALSANCFGASLGAIVGGRLADKYGRKTIYTYNMLIYMLGVGIIMFAFNFPMLLIGFLITGISVGVGVPASWTYISETSEVKNRARNIGISQFAWSIGPAIIFVLGALLSPLGLLGNRIIFGTLFLVALIAWILQRQLNESKAWEESKAEENLQTTKQEHPYKAIFTNSINLKTLLFLVGIYLTWNFVAGAMGFFMPYVFETSGGVSSQYANTLNVVEWVIISGVTLFGFAKLGDKVNQRYLYIFGTLLGLSAWVVLTVIGVSSKSALWIFVILWGVHAGFGVQAFYALWASELFPAKYRAAAQGVMFFLVRGGAAIWSFVFVYIYEDLGFTTAGYVMIGLLAIALIIGAIWAPDTQGKTLDRITEERYGKNS